MDSKEFFMSKQQIEEVIYSLNKSIEERKSEYQQVLTRKSILEFSLNKDENKLQELKERLKNE